MALLPTFQPGVVAMKYVFAFLFFVVLVPCDAHGQNNNQGVKSNSTDFAQSGKIKICPGLPIPEGYTIVAFVPHTACPQGAFVLQKESLVTAPQPPEVKAIAVRPRKVSHPINSKFAEDENNLRPPALNAISLDPPFNPLAATSSLSTNTRTQGELNEGDVVRIDTNLVSVPVSVMDRQGRFIGDLLPEKFKVFEND